MAHILITAGPTREFLDPVRYLSNASSGTMACALAQAWLARGHQVTIVTGPVSIQYPPAATVVPVVTTQEMLNASVLALPECDGVMAVAAPCDFRPAAFSDQKIKKQDDQGLTLQLLPTPDILAALTAQKPQAWFVGFALETENGLAHAIAKKKKKGCDWILLNQASAIGSSDTTIQIIDHRDQAHSPISGDKFGVAVRLVELLEQHFVC